MDVTHYPEFEQQENPPVCVHFSGHSMREAQRVKVMYKDPKTGEWKGPVPPLFTGRGHFCVLTDSGPGWIPSRWTHTRD